MHQSTKTHWSVRLEERLKDGTLDREKVIMDTIKFQSGVIAVGGVGAYIAH